MKKKIFAVCLVLICLSITATGTLSYFTSESVAHNVITTGNVKIELKEEFPPDGVHGVMPGDGIPKTVWVENTGSAPAWVKIEVKLTATAENGTELPTVLPDGTELISAAVLPGWTKGGDGCYYYEEPLNSNDKTSNLMEKVTFSPDMGDEYQNCTVNVDITAYGVQSDNNGATVFEADGWPAA